RPIRSERPHCCQRGTEARCLMMHLVSNSRVQARLTEARPVCPQQFLPFLRQSLFRHRLSCVHSQALADAVLMPDGAQPWHVCFVDVPDTAATMPSNISCTFCDASYTSGAFAGWPGPNPLPAE